MVHYPKTKMIASDSTAPADVARSCFIARQPIFDTSRNVFGYELLFRSGFTGGFTHTDGDQASSLLIGNTLTVFGLFALTGNTRAFINFTHNVLVEGHAFLLPQKNVIVELLEFIEPTPEVIQACRSLKEAGYVLAMDDFLYDLRLEPLLEMADIIKVGFRAASPEQCRTYASQFASRGKKMLAEKVETWQEWQDALDWGYHYFQGYFFSKPETLSGRDLPPSKLATLRLLQELGRSEMDFRRVEQILKQEPSLALKFLGYLNSALFGWQSRITSIRNAAVLLGQAKLQRWVSLFAIAGLCKDNPPELLVTCASRARFCEMLGQKAKLPNDLDLFLVGLLSLLPPILGQPLEDLLSKLAVSPQVREALEGAETPLARIYRLVQAYELGDWQAVSALCQALGLDETLIIEPYMQSVTWATETTRKANRAYAR